MFSEASERARGRNKNPQNSTKSYSFACNELLVSVACNPLNLFSRLLSPSSSMSSEDNFTSCLDPYSKAFGLWFSVFRFSIYLYQYHFLLIFNQKKNSHCPYLEAGQSWYAPCGAIKVDWDFFCPLTWCNASWKKVMQLWVNLLSWDVGDELVNMNPSHLQMPCWWRSHILTFSPAVKHINR